MSKLELAFEALTSVVDRKIASASDTGLRRIATPTGGDGGDNGFLKFLKWAGGWIINGIGSFFNFTWTQLWGFAVQYTTFVYNFNWNATDQQLDQLISNQMNIISSMLGGTVGNLLGWVVCGIAPAAGIMYFNEALGLKVLEEVGEEALDEFLANMQVLCQQAAIGLAQSWAITCFKAERRLIKSIAKNPKVAQLLGDKVSKLIQAWGEPGSKPWSFRSAVEEAIDNIENDWIRNFVEEGYEEFLDACVEAGYVVAGGVDDWAIKQSIQRNSILGQERIVEVTLDREIPNERIIIAGREETVRTTLTNVMSQYQLIENRDVGMIMGEPLRENLLRVKPTLTLLLQWSFYETPPFFRGARRRLLQCSIPGIKRSRIDWAEIKLAMGGANGYLWGRFKACARLVTDSDQRTSPVFLFAGSAQEAEERLKALLMLSDYKIASFSVVEELKEGRKAQGRALYKETQRIYPAYMTLCNAQKVINEAEGRTTLTGTYKTRRNRIEMFRDTKPYDFDEVIQEILSTPGADL